MSRYNDRPKLQASRYGSYSRRPVEREYMYEYNHSDVRRGRKRQYEVEDDYKSYKKHKSYDTEQLSRPPDAYKSTASSNYNANSRLQRLRNEIKTDQSKPQTSTASKPVCMQSSNSNRVPENNLYSKINVSPCKKNIASDRLKNLRKSIEFEKDDNIKTDNISKTVLGSLNAANRNHESTKNSDEVSIEKNKISDRLNKNTQEVTTEKTTDTSNKSIKEVTESNCKDGRSSKRKSISDRLKRILDPTENNNIKCKPSTSKIPDSQTVDLTESPTKPLDSVISPVKLEKKIDKAGFTNDWIAHTNFDGDSSSMMEISTQAKANDTVANLDTVTGEVVDMEWTSEMVNAKQMFAGKNIKSHDICVIVDTNIFIHNLNKIKDIIKVKVSGATIPIIYIPWMVITELDYMKDTSHDLKLKKTAFTAVKYINEMLSQKHPRFMCQTIFDVDKQKQMGTSPDDKIISCCLQALETYEYVFLFSNDINLKNKAMIHDIPACSATEILIRIMAKLNKALKVQTVMSKMSMLCTYIIIECVKECYGSVWCKMDMLTPDQPWPFPKCLKIFKRYWAGVFKTKLLKQFLKTVDETLTFLNNTIHICDDSKDYIDFVKLSVTLCIFLKDFEEHRGMVVKTIQDITKIS